MSEERVDRLEGFAPPPLRHQERRDGAISFLVVPVRLEDSSIHFEGLAFAV